MGATLNRVSRNDTYAGHTTLEVEVCASCGVLFAAPKRLLESCQEDGDAFFCPNGHSLVFNNYENKLLKRERDRLKDRLAAATSRADQTEASLQATKGVVTKQKKKLEKVVAGVCPVDGCHRHFKDVRQHIATKHPDYKATA
jgi:hypothetical protein